MRWRRAPGGTQFYSRVACRQNRNDGNGRKNKDRAASTARRSGMKKISASRVPIPVAPQRSRAWRLTLLALLLLAGAAFAFSEPVDRQGIMAWGESLAQWPWTAVALVLAQILLFALGMPGTMIVWLVAPFYPPLIAILLMLTGSVAGAALAYPVAGYLGDNLYDRLQGRRTFQVLAARGDVFTQMALRVLPGFPHAIVNYSAGLLQLPWRGFLLAAVLGLSVKWTVYCWSIHALFQQGMEGDGPGAGALLLLVALTLFLGGGSWLSMRLKARAVTAD